MEMRNKIVEVFTKYGYVIVDANEPEEPGLLQDIEDLNLEFILVNGGFRSLEYKIQGLYSDIYDVLAMNWGDEDEYIKGFVNLSKGEK